MLTVNFCEKNVYMCVYVRMCVVRACVRARVCVCVCVSSVVIYGQQVKVYLRFWSQSNSHVL